MRFRGRRSSHTSALSAAAAGQIVWEAEELRRQAWAHELLRRQAHLEFARSAASHDRDAARTCLAAAQRDGDPRAIGLAHLAFEQALEAFRQSAQACEQIHRSLRVELDLQARAARVRAVAPAVHRLERNGSAVGTDREWAPASQTTKIDSVPLVPRLLRRLWRRLSGWRFRLVARRAAGLQRS